VSNRIGLQENTGQPPGSRYASSTTQVKEEGRMRAQQPIHVMLKDKDLR